MGPPCSATGYTACRPAHGRSAATDLVAPPIANSVCLAARKYRWIGWSHVDADTAAHMHRGMGDAMAGVGRPERSAGHVDIGGEILGQPPGGLGERGPQCLDVDIAVGQPRGHRLEAADRPVELLCARGRTPR